MSKKLERKLTTSWYEVSAPKSGRSAGFRLLSRGWWHIYFRIDSDPVGADRYARSRKEARRIAIEFIQTSVPTGRKIGPLHRGRV